MEDITEPKGLETKTDISINVSDGTSWWKKILIGIAAVFGALIVGFSFFGENLNTIDSKIKDKKKEDKDLKEKSDKIQAKIGEDEKTSKKIEEKIHFREADFSDFLNSTAKEAKKFDTAREEIQREKGSTDANIDWVKSKFRGEVEKHD